MILNLKDIFLCEGSVMKKALLQDMSDVNFSGVKPFVAPVSVDVTAENRAGLVKLSLATSFNFQKPCDRCGTDVNREFHYNFEHYPVTSLSGDQNDDYIETPDYTIDIDELVRDDILLELPSKYLCSNECKGLCPKCGINLNEKTCGCTVKETDPRLEALRKLIE